MLGDEEEIKLLFPVLSDFVHLLMLARGGWYVSFPSNLAGVQSLLEDLFHVVLVLLGQEFPEIVSKFCHVFIRICIFYGSYLLTLRMQYTLCAKPLLTAYMQLNVITAPKLTACCAKIRFDSITSPEIGFKMTLYTLILRPQ